jgi:nucleotide-binding universal stress UspA family protein
MDTPTMTSASMAAHAGAEPIRRILLGTDLSAVSDRAVEHAIALASEHGAALVVLTVVDPKGFRLPGGRFLKRIDEERARAENAAQLLVARARAAGVRATFLVWEGDPVESIVSASAAERADIVVLGSHGRGRIGRLVRGSISDRVSGQAECQVVVVPAGPGSPEGD